MRAGSKHAQMLKHVRTAILTIFFFDFFTKKKTNIVVCKLKK